jgi:hypothetical protein
VASKKGRGKPTQLATFSSIVEPEVCSYEVIICTPLLCGGSPRNVSAFGLLEPLADTCLVRHEGECLSLPSVERNADLGVRLAAWWSYEFCFGKGIRQFHMESDPKKKNAPPRVLSEFSLGMVRRRRCAGTPHLRSGESRGNESHS